MALKANGSLPLQGVRVMEFCWVWSGPFLGQFLADLGAEVIKVEWYQRFDLYRTRGVERLRGKVAEEHRREMSPAFHSVNRNKTGLTLNLKEPDGLDLALQLASKSDVVIDNFTSGTMEKLGLGANALHEVNPQLVVVSLSGFGRGSRLDSMRAYGSILSAISGIEADIAYDDGEFVGTPTFIVSDPNAALFGLLQIVLGLADARRAGEGSTAIVSQLEAAMSLFGGHAPQNGQSEQTSGIFATQESETFVAVTASPAVLAAVGVQADGLAAWCAERQRAEVIEAVQRAGGVAVPVQKITEAAESEFYADTVTRVSTIHPVTGPEQLVASPWRVDGGRAPYRKPAPTLGEGTTYVLSSILGLGDERIEELRAGGVI